MAHLNVNPTKMERTKQRGRERIARRSHKLLKDSYDEILRQFLIFSKQAKELREEVERELARALGFFMTAQTHMTAKEIESAVSHNAEKPHAVVTSHNIMGLVIPQITLSPTVSEEQTVYATTNSNFDRSIHLLKTLFPKIIELGNVEKTCDMLSAEINRIRRRLNALEHIMIPQIVETIKYITMKLAENERGNQVRLMKVKEFKEK